MYLLDLSMNFNLIFLFLLLFSTNVQGCTPLAQRFWEETSERVKSNFDGAQFVVIADVVDITKIPAKILPGEIEQVTFRVERAFKGVLKAGDQFTIESGRTSCALGVQDIGWRVYMPERGAAEKLEYPKRWLIYYTPINSTAEAEPWPFEITSSPLTRPTWQAKYDIDILNRFSIQWDRGH